MRTFFVASLVVAALAPAPVAQALCMQPVYSASILTTRDTHLPVDGGVLVGTVFGASDDPPSDDPSNVKWTAANGKTAVALTRTSLAPGLSVFKPAAKTTAFAVANTKGKQLATFTVDGKLPAPALAPAVKSLRVVTTRNHRWSTTTAKVAFAKAPPAEAFAVIVYELGADAKTPTAIGFGRLPDTHDKLLAFDVLAAGGHCGVELPGQGMPAVGQKIAFAYVDAFGRVGPLSAAVRAGK